MAFSYECDFYLQSQRLTPITKRLPVRLGTLKCISTPMQWNRDNFFNSYLGGDTSALWLVGTSYLRYDRVKYLNKIYECTNNIVGVAPLDATGASYWTEVVADFRGAAERIRYNCQTLMIECILNRWFGTPFIQPPAAGAADANTYFYIVNKVRGSNTFKVADSNDAGGTNSSVTPQLSTDMVDWVGDVSGFDPSANQYNFEVHYPLATISTIHVPEYYQMTALVDKYKTFGSTVHYISH